MRVMAPDRGGCLLGGPGGCNGVLVMVGKTGSFGLGYCLNRYPQLTLYSCIFVKHADEALVLL